MMPPWMCLKKTTYRFRMATSFHFNVLQGESQFPCILPLPRNMGTSPQALTMEARISGYFRRNSTVMRYRVWTHRRLQSTDKAGGKSPLEGRTAEPGLLPGRRPAFPFVHDCLCAGRMRRPANTKRDQGLAEGESFSEKTNWRISARCLSISAGCCSRSAL